MASVGAFEAKTHLSRLLDRVAEGEEITITRHGEPVAVLVPPHPVSDRLRIRALIGELRERRKGRDRGRTKDTTVRKLTDTGRKY